MTSYETLETDDAGPAMIPWCSSETHNRSVLDSGIDSYRLQSSGVQSLEENLHKLRLHGNAADPQLHNVPTICAFGFAQTTNETTNCSNVLQSAPNPYDLALSPSAPNLSSNSVNQTPTQFSLEELFKQDEDGDTQLHLAIIQPDISVALWLIECAFIPDYLNIQNNNFLHTPLHLAVITNQPLIVKALMLSGVSLTMRDKQGNTALHLACMQGYMECVQQLTTPPNEQEKQYVDMYCISHRLPSRNVLYMQSKDMCLLNYEGETCLHVVQASHSNRKLDIIGHLVRICNADVNMQEGKCGYTILHQAVKAKRLESVAYILGLPNVSMNQCCYNGCTALGIASSIYQDQMVNLLRRVGATMSPQDNASAGYGFEEDQMEEFDDLTIGGQRLT